jgi:hypothetical protein
VRAEIRALLATTALSTSACIAPSVVASSGRAVVVEESAIAWRAATAEDLIGFLRSERIEGDVAASLSRIDYYFAADGFYTGAALVLGGAHPEFQTLNGTWRLDAEGLVLDEGAPVECSANGERVRIATPDGTVVLRRGDLE